MHQFSEASWQTFSQTLGLRDHLPGIYYTSVIQIPRFHFLPLPSARTPITRWILQDFKTAPARSDGFKLSGAREFHRRGRVEWVN